MSEHTPRRHEVEHDRVVADRDRDRDLTDRDLAGRDLHDRDRHDGIDRHRVLMQEDIVRSPFARGALAFLRIVTGWIFLWAFFDKLLGLGYSTPSERAWMNGGSPTRGFLSNASGAFGEMFQSMASASPFLDWLFMLGLLGIGIAMITGAGVKLAAITGTLLVFLMYLASFPWGQEGQTNPITTSHWIEAAALITAAATRAGDTFGLGKWWARIVGDGILR